MISTRGKFALQTRIASLTLSAILIGVAFTFINIQPVSALPIPIAACMVIAAAGTYQLTVDIAATAPLATCISITTGGVTLDMNGHTLSCTDVVTPGYMGSCQVLFGPIGIDISGAPSPTSVTVNGPGAVTGFDTGIHISSSNALIKGLTITGPPSPTPNCSFAFPAAGVSACANPRPLSTGIEVSGVSGVNILNTDESNHADGIEMSAVTCPPTITDPVTGAIIFSPSCVINGNKVHDNTSDPITCHGITLDSTTGYTVTRNKLIHNGETGSNNAGIILFGASTGNTITNNDSSDNRGFGIAAVSGPSGNTIVNNVARTNDMVANPAGGVFADLGEIAAGPNTWNNNNICNTETGTVPAGVCNPGE